jgi:hypothetical protein
MATRSPLWDDRPLKYDTPIVRWLIRKRSVQRVHHGLRWIAQNLRAIDVAMALTLIVCGLLLAYLPDELFTARRSLDWRHPSALWGDVIGNGAALLGIVLLLPRRESLRWVNGWWPLIHDVCGVLGGVTILFLGIGGAVAAALAGVVPLSSIAMIVFGVCGTVFSGLRFYD